MQAHENQISPQDLSLSDFKINKSCGEINFVINSNLTIQKSGSRYIPIKTYTILYFEITVEITLFNFSQVDSKNQK